MSLYSEEKYINLISRRLDGFAWKSKTIAACRCPKCGDSKRDRSKKRFYFFVSKGTYFVKCHNCQFTTSFSNFLEESDINLYREYLLERFGNNSDRANATKDAEKKLMASFSTDTEKKFLNPCLNGLPSIASLDDTHYAKQYVLSRKIPTKFHSVIFYAENFREVVHKLDPTKNVREEPRLVIPFYDVTGYAFALQGRALDKGDAIRYITIRDPEYLGHKIYGLERYNPMLTGYVVEGPIDSLFLPNTIASAGSDLATLTDTNVNTKKLVFVYDNEPRNREICSQIEKCIDKGYKVCIWPPEIELKDVNDMVLSGINPHIAIDMNTYEGLAAKIKFTEWKKV